MAQAAQAGLLIRVDTKSAEFEQKHLKGVILCDFKSAKISSPTRFVNSRIRQLFHDHPHFVHSRAGPDKVTVLCSNRQTLDDCIREGYRVIEDTKDVTGSTSEEHNVSPKAPSPGSSAPTSGVSAPTLSACPPGSGTKRTMGTSLSRTSCSGRV